MSRASVGSEIDLTMSTKLFNGRVGILVGYSHFYADDYVRQTGSPLDKADFAFVQTKLDF